MNIEFPCKVGDKVFYIFQYSNKRLLPFVRTGVVRKIWCATQNMRFHIDIALSDSKEIGVLRTFAVSDFGKIAFLSREEAEQALRKEE